VLERAGYLLDEIDAMLDPDAAATYPDDLVAFRDDLDELETLGGVARRVFDRYGLAGPVADHVLTTVQSAREATTMTRGDLIRFVERGIEQDTTREIDTGTGTDAVTVQTIHATKGLEHPIVVLANMNRGRFPPHGGDSQPIRFDDPIGLRQRKLYDETAYDRPHVLDDWRTDVLRHCLPRGYDEERRLLYVAVTRAKHHLVLAAGEDPNAFVEELPVDIERLEPDVTAGAAPGTTQSTLAMDILPTAGPTGHTPHTLMRVDEGNVEDDGGGRGREFGTEVHEFAEAYATGEAVTPSNTDEEHVVAFLDGLDGAVRVEVDAALPIVVDDRRVTVTGVVDLIHVTPDRVEVIDYKTDTDRHREPAYRTQLSIYHHVARSVYPDREVTSHVLYTMTDDLVAIDPLSLDERRAVVRERDARAAPSG